MQLVDRLTEEEAEACLKAFAETRETPKKTWHDPREDEWPTPGKPPEEVAEFLRALAKDGPTLSDEDRIQPIGENSAWVVITSR